MAGLILIELFTDESLDPLPHQTRLDSLVEILVERVVAAKETRIHQRGAHLHVVLRQPHAIGDAARRVPNLERGVPQGIEQLFCRRTDKRRDLAGVEKQEINI